MKRDRLRAACLALLLSSGPALAEPPDWIHDVLVAAHPAAAVGGPQAGIYTPAVNGVRPWRNAMLRWLTGRHVMGNTAVLVRQEGREGGAGLAAILDPQADYVLQVSAFVPGGGEFGEAQEGGLQLSAAVLGPNDAVIAEAPLDTAAGQWKSSRMAFHNGRAREVRVVVCARAPQRLPCVYYVDDFRLTRADRWWSPQNVFDEARTATRLADDRWKLCQALDPDMLTGHNGPYLKYVTAVAPARIKKGRDAVLADPVLRAYVQFQYASQLERWRETVAAVKRAAGHTLAVCGNQWGAGGQRPYSVALSPIGDVVAVEAGGRPHNAQNRAWDTLSAKLGQAAGEYQRPVWLYLTSLFHASEAARSRLRFTAAQAWADGGVPTPWATAPGSSGWFFDTEARLCRFVQSQRALFARRDRVANVGLVYSLPTHAWRRFRAFNLSPEPMQQWFGAWARLLEEAHVPYEVNCWSHPLLGSDRVSLARLERYRVLVLPGVDCFTDAQRDALRAFQARGGRVVNVRCEKYYDADAVLRPAGETLAAKGDTLVEVDPAWMLSYGRTVAKPTAATAAAARTAGGQLTGTLRRAVGADAMLATDGPSTVWANLWLDDTRQVLALHLVNGDIDLAADRLRPVAGSRWRVHLPSGLRVDRAVELSPDSAGERPEPQPLAVELAGGWATVVVPRVESYTIVALFQGQALSAANDLAASRRARWRASLLVGQTATNPVNQPTHPDKGVTP